ncbi:MAG: chromosome condensation regulator RCC1 [Xanthomonadales bacterium]|nr:chromosome condensation regulator RCC1 [Xanthomonadales bacterium]
MATNSHTSRTLAAALAGLCLLLLQPATSQAQQLAAGGGHTCAVVPGGNLHCWGWDEQGQLGDAAQNYSNPTPVRAEGLTNVISADGGYQHSCAVTSAGGVWCWGYNRWGQIGNGSGADAHTPTAVVGLSNALAVGTGGNHSCAMLATGAVWCWGHGYHGQLGSGSFMETNVPVQVVGISTASAIATGENHSCAIVGGGAIKCWGRNHQGQLGNGAIDADPGVLGVVDVFGITTAIALSAGNNHTCALLLDGTVRCWGDGARGALGNGVGMDYSAVPVTVVGINDATALASGDLHNCVIHSGGGMSCWGYNYFGSVGDGSNRNDRATPVTVIRVSDVTAIAAGGSHTCARVREDPINVMCWGNGSFGQLGNGRAGGTVETPRPGFVLGDPFDIVFGGDPGDFE